MTRFEFDRLGHIVFVAAVSLCLIGCQPSAPSADVPSAAEVVGEPESTIAEPDEIAAVIPPASNEPAADVPAVAVTLEQLEAEADPQSKFAGKQVELTAKVAQPGKLSYEHDAIGVALTKDGKLDAILGSSPFVTALFAREGEESLQLRTLTPHQEVTLTGELRMAADNVWELHGAKLVKVGDDPSTAVSSQELTQAFLDDQEAAAAKYQNQPLRISGIVAGKPVRFGQFAAVSLIGAKDGEGRTTTVIAQFRPDHFNTYGSASLNGTSLAEMLPWKDGDEIEIVGTLQMAEFGTGPDGQPGLAVVAYPTQWPVK